MTLRQASLHELETVIRWATLEGWNPGVEDAAAFFDTDPEGFFVAVEDGSPVASISVVNHNDDHAFLGLYLCQPDYRGKGIAYALWKHAMAHAGRRTIGLDGVQAQQDNYRKSGFEPSGETHRHSGEIAPRRHEALRFVTHRDLAAMARLEAEASGVDKPAFLEAWTTETTTRRTLALERDGGIAGFVTARRCMKGIKIGPLVARTDEDAQILLHGAASVFPDEPAMIDIPDDVPSLSDYCASLGMTVTFSTARMYRGKPPVPGPYVRAVATLELG